MRFAPADVAFIADPYADYAELRESEPVHYDEATDHWLVSRYADVDALLRDRRFGRTYLHVATHEEMDRPVPPDWHDPFWDLINAGILDMEPPDHTRVRKLIMGALTRRAIAEMEPGLIALVEGLLDRIEGQGGGDLIEDFASAIPVEIIGNLLGVPHADRGPLRGWSLAILGALEPKLTPEQEALGNRSVSEFTAYLKTLVADRRKHPGDPEHDVLTRLIQGEDAGDRLS